MRLHELIGCSAQQWPEKIAVTDGHGSITYAELAEKVDELSRKLKASGVGPGHGVGIKFRNGREFIIAAFAVFSAGGVLLPIFHQMKGEEVEELVRSTGLHAVIDDEAGDMRLSWTGEDRERAFADFVDDPVFVRFTSGTTGASKGVVLTNRGVLERTAAANIGLGLTSGDVVLWLLPMSFHFLVSIVLYLEVGATIVVSPDHLAGTILDLANRHSATFLYASPTHYRLLAADRSGAQLPTIKKAISTSSTLPPEVSRAFFERYGLAVWQAYGIIEVGIPLINDRSLEKPESVGRPVGGCEASVMGEDLLPVPHGHVGQLAFKGPGMFAGYMSPPRETKEILSSGWFLSGDQAVQDEDGYFTIAGRSKSMINVAGNKVFPEEVEAVLNRHPHVEASRVFKKPHPQMGEVVHADVLPTDSGRPLDMEELLDFCRIRLSGYKVPHSVSIVIDIGRTLSGKISRKE